MSYGIANRFDLRDYETLEELQEVLADVQDEQSILRGYERGIKEKIATLEADDDEQVLDDVDAVEVAAAWHGDVTRYGWGLEYATVRAAAPKPDKEAK